MRRRILASALLFSAGVAAVLTCEATKPPSLQQFIVVIVAPIAAALCITRSARWPFLTAAAYAALAGIRSFVAQAGEVTLLNQLSTAAYLALIVPIVTQAVQWIASKRKPVS